MVLRFENCGQLKHKILVENSYKILPKVTDYVTQNRLNYIRITSNGELSDSSC